MPVPARPPRIPLLGVPVDALDAAGVRAWLRDALADPWDGRCRHVVTLNPEYVMAARRLPGFAAAIAAADLVVADGVGVAVLARLLADRGDGSPARVTGVELVEWLAAERSPLYLLGAGPGVAEAAARALRGRFPGVAIAGAWGGGSPRPDDDAATLRRIAGSGARVLLVAYGAPGQVTWIARNRGALAAAGVRLAVGVGGTMDYLAGRVPRAPAWVRRMGLEWLYRLGREPWRWRRQSVLPRFAILGGLAWLWRRGNRARRWVRLMGSPGSPGRPPSPTSPGRSNPDLIAPAPSSSGSGPRAEERCEHNVGHPDPRRPPGR